MNARLYIVSLPGGGVRLVKALSQAQAISHIVKPLYTARIAKPLEVVELLSAGHVLGDATAPVHGDDVGQEEGQPCSSLE